VILYFYFIIGMLTLQYVIIMKKIMLKIVIFI